MVIAFLMISGMTHTSRCGHVLVVEDDCDIREAIEEALTIEGYRVKTAVNGKEALEMLKSAPPQWRPCFILLDLMMPVMNGWEFLLVQRADPELSKIPVMICSAVADRGKYPGILEFIKKPLDLDDLLNLVGKHCDPAMQMAHADP